MEQVKSYQTDRELGDFLLSQWYYNTISYQITVDIYRHLLPNQLEKGLDELDLMLVSVDKSVESMK